MHAAPRKKSSIKSDLKNVNISEKQWTNLCQTVNVLLDGFINDMSFKYDCSEIEVRVFCFCYCGGSNNMLELCLPYKKQTIANMKQQIAHKVLGNDSTWNELMLYLSNKVSSEQKDAEKYLTTF